MKIEFYPYDFEYKVRGEDVFVRLYSKQKDGKKIIVEHRYEPYFYAKLAGVDVTRLEKKLKGLTIDDVKVVSWEKVVKSLISKDEDFLKVIVNSPKAIPILSKELGKLGVQTYEKDILFIHRYLRDSGIVPMELCSAEGEVIGKERAPIFKASSVSYIGGLCEKWKVLAIDIETYSLKKEIDPQINPILMISFYGSDGFEKVITWKKVDSKKKYVEVVKDETEMLQRFRDHVVEYDADIITGYFTDGFDFPYLKARADKLKVKLDLSLDGSELFINSRSGFRDSECKIKGMLHLDLLKFVRNIFGGNLKTDSYSLDAVAGELLGHRKHVVDLDELAPAWDNNDSKLLKEFVEYNLQDSKLTLQLFDELFLDMVEFTRIVGLPLFDVIRMKFSRLVESYIMKRGVEHNVIAPNKASNDEIEKRMKESIQGAFVYEPKPGLYKDIVLFDFRSLYPTIICAHNLGPGSFMKEGCKNPKEVPGREQYWFCEDEKSFLPMVLENLILRRSEVKKQIKKKPSRLLEARSYALKILGNSFYGYLAFYGARWYSFESAASTTAYARDYIQKTIAKAQKDGFEVVYSDTDSCFLLLGEKKMDEAMKFMKRVNKDLPGHMELEYEGHFTRGIFVALKGSDKGAKKKYALIREDGSMKITGFETVRRNWSDMAKNVQKEVLRMVLSGKEEEAVEHVKDVLSSLRDGAVDLNQLVMRTQLTRPLSKYKSVGPHVKVARKLAAAGEKVEPGMVVEYIITKGSGTVGDRAESVEVASNYDPEYYINHQLIPAVESILAVLGYTEDDLLSGSKQEGLGKFF